MLNFSRIPHDSTMQQKWRLDITISWVFFFFPPPGAIFVGATVSWLMADSGRLQTDRDRGVRESKDQVSFSSLSHIMSGGQWGTGKGGGGRRLGGETAGSFLAGIRGCADTHMISHPDTNMSLSCGVSRSAQTRLDTVWVSVQRLFHLKQTSSYTLLVYQKLHGLLD